MTIEDIQAICAGLGPVTEDIKWENDLCFCVGAKMFAVVAVHMVPASVSFKASDENFAELSERQGCKPAPYLAKHQWIYVDDINRFSKKQWQLYLAEAYRLVAAKLPAKTKKQLGIIIQ
jgi:predicted DNA-binding protein (MmcQ/YjbR family)